jgi:hypothetical protein
MASICGPWQRAFKVEESSQAQNAVFVSSRSAWRCQLTERAMESNFT